MTEDLSDEQLLAELEGLDSDPELQPQGCEGASAAAKDGSMALAKSGPAAEVQADVSRPTPASPQTGCAGSSSAPAKEKPTLMENSATAANPDSSRTPKHQAPAPALKKRGLVAPGKKPTELANASAFAKPSAPATKKVIVGRVVRNEDSCEDLGPADNGAEAHKANLSATQANAAAAGDGAKKKGLSMVKASADKAPAASEAAPTPVKAPKKRVPKAAAQDGAAKVKRATSAYIFFCANKRDSLKANNPSLGPTDLTKRLGELWKALPADEKAPFEALAQADKERADRERGEAKATATPAPKTAKPKNGGAADEETPQKAPRAKSAYQLFCAAKRAEVKAANPGAGFSDTPGLLAAAWKDASEADRTPFQQQHEEQKEQLQASGPAAPTPKHAKKTARPAAPARKRAAPDADASDADEADEEEEAVGNGTAAASPVAKKVKEAAPSKKKHARGSSQAPAVKQDDKGEDDDGSIEQDMMNVDWEEHPAEHIVAETYHHKYLVKRKGLDLSACGLVDARAAKRQRMALAAPVTQHPGEADQAPDDAAPACPVTLAMMDEFDAFSRSFQCAVHAHSEGGELDLDDLNQDSPLESCCFLGIMREQHFPLSKVADKNKDVMIKVPMMGLSRTVQRMVCLERKAAAELRAQLDEERAQCTAHKKAIMQLQAQIAGNPGKAGGVMESQVEE